MPIFPQQFPSRARVRSALITRPAHEQEGFSRSEGKGPQHRHRVISATEALALALYGVSTHRPSFGARRAAALGMTVAVGRGRAGRVNCELLRMTFRRGCWGEEGRCGELLRSRDLQAPPADRGLVIYSWQSLLPLLCAR